MFKVTDVLFLEELSVFHTLFCVILDILDLTIESVFRGR